MAKDLFHDLVRKALENEGWTITHDPYTIVKKEEKIDYAIDLGAERLIAAEKENEKIAVEVKSFLKPSLTNEFHTILGQYLTYIAALKQFEPDRELLLAIPLYAEERLAEYPFIRHLIDDFNIQIIVFDKNTETIISWKK